ncbi:HU family DNA-binding protein [Bacteroides sp. 224]|uniref:HU family DNA-binding protein n=1 Tax=Bacteroides sp. 224 TaxID=2302936 RepID=UPI0013D715B2|nr:HU family DNA-binding protein [Bacteroides sp. 224]NDV66412.1 DNA-binding protein [Bacteroides sp. 224]
MSVIYRVVERPSNPLVANSPKKHYPLIVTVGRKVDTKFISEKIRDSSSLSMGDILSVLQNFVEKLKEQLLEGKTVNIDGLGVFMLSAQSNGADKAEDVTADTVKAVRICFQASKALRISKASTRAGEKLTLIKLEDYLKNLGLSVGGNLTGGGNDDGAGGNDDGGSGGGGDEFIDPSA